MAAGRRGGRSISSRSRPMALGLLQALSAIGNMMASVITLTLARSSRCHQATSWAGRISSALRRRYCDLDQSSVKEPPQWHEAKRQASMGKELGKHHPSLHASRPSPQHHRRRAHGHRRRLRRLGRGLFQPDFVREELRAGGLAQKAIDTRVQHHVFLPAVGAFLGIYLFAVFAERFSRKEAFYFWFGLAWASVRLFLGNPPDRGLALL